MLDAKVFLGIDW